MTSEIHAIGVAIYNRPDLLTKLVESIDFPVQKFIVVNNGCIPGMSFSSPHVTEFHHVNPGKNLGCSGGWNCIQDTVFNKLNLDHVIICGNDIQWMANDLEKFHKTLVDFQEADFIFGNHSYSNFMVKRSGWEKIGAFDENAELGYLEDGDHWQRILRSPAKAIHVAGLNSLHAGSATVNSDPNFRKKVNAQHERNWSWYSAKWGCPKHSHAAETYATPFNKGGPINKWSLDGDRVNRPHYFPKWPM